MAWGDLAICADRHCVGDLVLDSIANWAAGRASLRCWRRPPHADCGPQCLLLRFNFCRQRAADSQFRFDRWTRTLSARTLALRPNCAAVPGPGGATGDASNYASHLRAPAAPEYDLAL